MVEPTAENLGPQCPWCSASLASDDEVQCHSCGAILTADTEPQLPGVTTIAAPGTPARGPQPKRPNRLLQWIIGENETAETTSSAPPGSVALPDADVRREMLRLQIQAELADLSAEAESLIADTHVEGLLTVEPKVDGASTGDSEGGASTRRPATWADVEAAGAGGGAPTAAADRVAEDPSPAAGSPATDSEGPTARPANGDADGANGSGETRG